MYVCRNICLTAPTLPLSFILQSPTSLPCCRPTNESIELREILNEIYWILLLSYIFPISVIYFNVCVYVWQRTPANRNNIKYARCILITMDIYRYPTSPPVECAQILSYAVSESIFCKLSPLMGNALDRKWSYNINLFFIPAHVSLRQQHIALRWNSLPFSLQICILLLASSFG